MRRRRRKSSIFGGNAFDSTQPLTQEKGFGGGAFDFKSKFNISSPSAPIEPTFITPEPDRGRTGFIPIGASTQPTPPRPVANPPSSRTTQIPAKSPRQPPFNGSGGGEIKPLNLSARRNNPSMPPVSLERSTSRSTMASGRNPIDSYISALGFDDPSAPYLPPNTGPPGTRGYTVIAKGNPYDFTASNGSPTYTATPGSPSSVYTYALPDNRRAASPPPPVPRLDYGRPGQGR
ncbi:hypothetical protein DFH27DRAFT_522052 [Peziza echinospora]|nr:hypothetical protein DFH27DRAFT_522052 [Peziza echinospora]